MKTAAKVFLLLSLLVAHKALVTKENPSVNFNEVVQKVNHSLSSWVTQQPRS